MKLALIAIGLVATIGVVYAPAAPSGQTATEPWLDHHLGEMLSTSLRRLVVSSSRRSEHGLRRLLCFDGGTGRFAQRGDNQLGAVGSA
jgi:hypothetical protein